MTRLSGIRILVVDDEILICEVLKDLLSLYGAQVDLCYDGQSALSFLSHSTYDILISDIRMPVCDGPTLISLIPQKTRENLLMYFCSGYNDLSIENMKQLGVRQIFAKPFNIDQIMNVLIVDLKK